MGVDQPGSTVRLGSSISLTPAGDWPARPTTRSSFISRMTSSVMLPDSGSSRWPARIASVGWSCALNDTGDKDRYEQRNRKHSWHAADCRRVSAEAGDGGDTVVGF